MINIFVTYRCNLSCPYCFACELQSEYPQDITEQEFARLLHWMRNTSVASAAFIGGEPTLHPGLAEMVRQAAESGITVTLFTNALCEPELISRLTPYIANFVVNYNSPEIYKADKQRDLLHQNLGMLARTGSRITFSKNFAPDNTEYSELLTAAGQYGVKAVRYDISRPSASCTNDHFNYHEAAPLMQHVVRFVRECDSRGIKTGLDCCIRHCDLSPDERSYLERVSMKFTGICHPSVDIHPDLSASYCLPLRHVAVPDVTVFPNCERLIHHFAAAVRPTRFENSPEECSSCSYFKKKCQGGCMATKQADQIHPAIPVKDKQKSATP